MSTTAQATPDQARQHLQQQVERMAQLCAGDGANDECLEQFTESLSAALAAEVCALWLVDGQSQLMVAARCAKTTGPDIDDDQLLQAAQKSLECARPVHVVLGEEDAPQGVILCAPILVDEAPVAVIQIVIERDIEPASAGGHMQFLLQMAALVEKRFARQHSTEKMRLASEVAQFCQVAHEHLDTRRAAYAIANEGRRVVGCDRVSVFVRHGRRFQAFAVSGQDVIERRANVVARMGALVKAVMPTRQPLWFTGEASELPPQISQLLSDYVDESFSKSLAVIPIFQVQEQQDEQPPCEAPIVGALVAEQMERADITNSKPALDLLLPHVARALTNARRYDGLFLMPMWRVLGRAAYLFQGRTLPKTAAVLALVAALALAATFVPADFTIKAEGMLQPALRHDVFASVDGVVKSIEVGHGDRVVAGQTLATLHNADLSVELETVVGQLHTLQKRLAAVQRARLARRWDLSTTRRNELAGEANQLEQQLDSLMRQYALLIGKHERLNITSPVTGEIITFQVEQSLLHRPVGVGHVLLTVAEPAGEWELDLYLPEDDIRYVCQARQSDSPVEVTFIIASAPETTHKGVLRQIDTAAHLHQEYGHAVRLTVDFDESFVDQLRPGAAVRANIHCGRAPIGFVWLHDLIEVVQRRVLF